MDASNNKVDLITGESITIKRVHTVPFRESSAFYNLYINKLINEENFEITPNISDYIKNWDGQKHYKTIDLNAEKYATEEYQKKYGGR